MARFKTYILAVATVFAALAIGFVMQNGSPTGAANQAGVIPSSPKIAVSGIVDTSSAVAPKLPSDSAARHLDGDKVVLAATAGPSATALPPSQGGSAPGFDCAISLDATPSAGAMVALELSAPCHASERVTIHHHGLMFTEITGPDGSLRVTVPVLSEQALFIAAFDNGDGETASAEVSALPFYDRVVLQWKGDSGLQLHAREYDAPYFSQGHVWAASAGDMTRTAKGEGGFLIRLGNVDAVEPLVAEIYSFPAGTAHQSGNVAVSVEAEVTNANCGKQVEAQTLEASGDAGLRVRDLTLNIPACDGVGDFLVLKNLIQDLKIAGN